MDAKLKEVNPDDLRFVIIDLKDQPEIVFRDFISLLQNQKILVMGHQQGRHEVEIDWHLSSEKSLVWLMEAYPHLLFDPSERFRFRHIDHPEKRIASQSHQIGWV